MEQLFKKLGITWGSVYFELTKDYEYKHFTESKYFFKTVVWPVYSEMLKRDLKFNEAMKEVKKYIKDGEKWTGTQVFNFLNSVWSFNPDEKATGKTWEEIKELLK